ncbi:porin [Massilia glaciei]|uniref:Porin n=1 Tax=Massilia glaciei TaxID=1524097 RepID=A0A2U2HGX6_9BURK|nr:porin [Massilia glaciei]PWF44671.1 porin [Massilia glaciei]
MQFKLLAAAICATLPLVASAQSSVTIYGVLDAAVAYEDNGAPNGSRTVLNSGNQSSSRFGFKGAEDIGSGLKAIFNLEGGVAIDTGMGDSALFGRRAVVGLQGSFGSVTLGREYTPIADVAKESDIFGQGFYGTNLSAFGTGRLTRRISNSVNYKSVPMSGLRVGAAYGAGEALTGPSLDIMGISADYTIGKFYVGAGYHTVERLASGDDKEMIVGAGYKMGPVSIKGNYMVADLTGANNKYEQVNLGASMSSGASTFYANYQQQKLEAGGAKGNTLAVAYSYAFSKRTNAYATYARLSNNATARFGINSSSTSLTPPPANLGADPSNLSIGVRHSF